MTLKKAGGIATIVSVVFGVGWALWIYFSPPKSNAPSTAQTAVVKGDDNVVVQGNNNVVNPPSAAGLMKRSEVDDSLIPGIWFAEYSYAGAKGSMNKLQTTMEYFENGRYRVDGQQAVTAYEQGRKFELIYGLTSVGDWRVSGRGLLITSGPIKSDLLSLKDGSQPIDISQIPQSEIRKHFRFIDEVLLPGTSERFEIVQLGKDHMHLRAHDHVGGSFEFDVTRVIRK